MRIIIHHRKELSLNDDSCFDYWIVDIFSAGDADLCISGAGFLCGAGIFL